MVQHNGPHRVYFINPSNEYIGGGSEKLDLIDHMSGTVLDYWTSGHYAGGAIITSPPARTGSMSSAPSSSTSTRSPTPRTQPRLSWTPSTPLTARYARRSRRLARQRHRPLAGRRREVEIRKAAWPYAWVEGVDYPHKDGRATVTGQLVLDDPRPSRRPCRTSPSASPTPTTSTLRADSAARRQRQHRHMAA